MVEAARGGDPGDRALAGSADPLSGEERGRRRPEPRVGSQVGAQVGSRIGAWVGWGIVAVSAAVILVLTLTPHPGAITVPPGFCILCGAFGTANLIRNVILFVPLGIGAGMVVGMGMRAGAGEGAGAAAGTVAAGRADRRVSGRFLRAWLPAVGLTAGIEVAQLFIPGRNPLVVDFLANAAGAAVGILLVGAFVAHARGSARGRGAGGVTPRLTRSPSWRPAWSLAWSLAWWGLSAVALAGTALAFRLVPPSPPHFVQIQADLAHFERYAGVVEGVWISGGGNLAGPGEHGEPGERERLEIGRHPNPAELEARVFGGSRVTVAFEAGPPPARIAPLFSVYTGAQREVFLLGIQGEDVVLRLPYLAATLRLDRPDHRIRGALRGLEPGERGELAFWRGAAGADGAGTGGTDGAGGVGGAADSEGDGSACLQLTRGSGTEDVTAVTPPATARACGLRPTLGQGWSLLLYPARLPPGLQSGLSWAWLLGLGFVPGLFSRSRRGALLAGVGLVLVAGAAPWLLGSTAILPVGQGLALPVGALLGWWGRSGLVGCLPEPDASRPNP